MPTSKEMTWVKALILDRTVSLLFRHSKFIEILMNILHFTSEYYVSAGATGSYEVPVVKVFYCLLQTAAIQRHHAFGCNHRVLLRSNGCKHCTIATNLTAKLTY